MEPGRIWRLLARKLTGDADARELTELEHLLFDHPRTTAKMDIIIKLWRKKTVVNDPEPINEYSNLLERNKSLLS